MYRVTTVIDRYTLPVDTSNYQVIRVTYSQPPNVKIIKTYQHGELSDGMQLDGRKVIITLTQEETKKFKSGYALSQVRALTNDGKAKTSKTFRLPIDSVLDDVVMV